jgi:HK97 family phage major capsid protein/HK97 family phage prohead protease
MHTMLTRAYSVLHVKDVNAQTRTFTGMATTPETDRIGDIVDQYGVTFKNPLPLLFHHDAHLPIGSVRLLPATDYGIAFEASIPVWDTPGALKDRLDEAWDSIKAGLMKGVSIGFRPLKDGIEIMKDGGYKFLKTEVLELSLVTIPANQQATIHTIKSCDVGAAALGTAPEARPTTPSGAADTTRTRPVRAGTSMKTITEQITAFEATKAANIARMNELMQAAAEAGSTLDAAQSEDYDTLEAENKELDKHLARAARHEATMKTLAKPVNGDSPEKASAARGGHVVTIKDNLPAGIEFARYAMCLASAKGFPSVALEIAKERYPDQGRVHHVLKAAVAAGTTTDVNWAGSLVQYQDFAGDFINFLRPATIIGKFGTNGIPSLNKVPFNIRVAGQTSGGSGYWVGEGKPKPLTKFDFTTITMTWAKVANIAVLTEEEVRFSSPSAEAKVRDALAEALIERLDRDFVDPAKALVAGVSPASITNGVTPIAASGTDADAVKRDFAALMGSFVASNISPTDVVLIMSGTTAMNISLMFNALGNRDFPDISLNGGTLLGIPVIVSQYLAAGGSPPTGLVILVNAKDIYLADDGQVVIDASREASVEMLDGTLLQNATVGTGASLVSLWQSNLLGLKAERFINWKKRRAGAVAYINNAAYVAG